MCRWFNSSPAHYCKFLPNSHLWLLGIFVFGARTAAAPTLHQILTDAGFGRPSCSVQKIIRHGKVELVGRGEVRVTRKDHDFVLAHPLGEPIGQGGATKIMELTLRNTGSLEDFRELPAEVVDNLQPGVAVAPPALPTELLDVMSVRQALGTVRQGQSRFSLCGSGVRALFSHFS